MRHLVFTLRIVLVIGFSLSFLLVKAQPRFNLNNWFLGLNVGPTVAHSDVRPGTSKPYFKTPGAFFGYYIVPEMSYHFTHGFGLVTNFTFANLRANEFDRNYRIKRYFDTDIREWKMMGHLNLGRALSFNLRKNIISPYISAGLGASWVHLKSPIWDSYTRTQLLRKPTHDTAKYVTWNKNIQIGFYVYLTRFLDLDIKYNYTFYNDDYVDGSSIPEFVNREWDKYSALGMGVRFKFGSNNRKTYEHTSWAREPMEEDTAMFNNLVVIEEFDDGYGNPIFKMRRPTTPVIEEDLTKIETNAYNQEDLSQAIYNTVVNNPNLRDSLAKLFMPKGVASTEDLSKIDAQDKKNDDMAQAIYNTVINNPIVKDSLLAELARDLRKNNSFIMSVQDGVCENCTGKGEKGDKGEPGEKQIVYIDRIINADGTVRVDTVENGGSTIGKGRTKPKPDSGVAGEKEGRVKMPDNFEFQLKNIVYDLDKYYITDLASKTLAELAAILKKYPSLQIELASHTDCRQTKSYNLALSEKRALAAVNYLVCQGIDRCRLVAKGYGESQPLNDCHCEGQEVSRECTEEEHHANRRTMVKILNYDYKPGSDCQNQISVDENAARDAANSSEKTVYTTYDVTDADIAAAGVNTNPKAGYYVVVKVSAFPAYGRNAVAEAGKAGFPNADIFYKDKNHYYIYVDHFDNEAEALARLKAVRCCTQYPDAWIYRYVK